MTTDDRPPFQRLEDRLAGQPPDTVLRTGVPDYLEHALRQWLHQALVTPGGYYRDDVCREVALRLRIPASPTRSVDPYTGAILWAPLKNLHEVVDAVLWRMATDAECKPPLGDLDLILTQAGSAYRVDDGGQQLVLRVDPTVETAFRAAADMDQRQQAGEFLQRAWRHAYGLKPDPNAAYRDAVRAVEEAFVPVVSPNNTRASLGTVCRDLANQQGKWELVLVDDRDQPADIASLLGLLRQLWQGQRSRHGGGSTSRDQTQAEAEAAVHLAALAVQWLGVGVLRRKP